MTEESKNRIYTSGCWEIDLCRRELRANGLVVPIGGRSFDIIEVLIGSPGRLLRKCELIAAVWPDRAVGPTTLAFHISAIRKAFGADRGMLTTAHGRGYRLVDQWIAKQPDGQEGDGDRGRLQLPVAPKATNLPTPVSDMIGRTTAVRQLRDLMSARRIVTLTGPGGIGKTRLALEVARIILPDFVDGVWFVDLAMLSDAGLVATVIAGILGFRFGANEITPESLAHTVGDRNILLFVDNCEHIVDAAATVVEVLLRRCPNTSVLATSREPMRIEGEHTYRVRPLDTPNSCPSEPNQELILESSAVQLFLARAAMWQRGIQDPRDLSAVAAICRRLDGIPLAIEFAAARAATFSLQKILHLLDDRFELLTSSRRTALPKHRTLRATLDWSYELLCNPERVLLQRLAIFTGPFSLEAASAVTRNGETSSAEIIDGIQNLITKSLINWDAAGNEHFRLLETTRQYALGKLIDSGEFRQIALRHSEYFCRLLNKNKEEAAEKPAHLADLGNVRTALEWCFGVNGNIELGVELASFAAPLFLEMSLLTECHYWSQQAILALDDTARGGEKEMRLQAALGMSAAFTLGNSETARSALSKSLKIAERFEDAPSQLHLLGILHTFHHRTGDFKAAMPLAERSSVVARMVGGSGALALGHTLLGVSYHHRGDLQAARVELEAALRQKQRSQQASTTSLGFDGLNIAGVVLARTLWLLGYPTQAEERMRQTVDDAASSDHQITLSIALVWAISLFLWTGDLGSAEEHLDRLVSRAKSHSLGPYIAACRGFKGELAVRRGDPETGVEALQGCLCELHASRHGLLTTAFTIALVEGLIAIARPVDGISLLHKTIEAIERKDGDIPYIPELHRLRGKALLSLPQPRVDEAKMCFVQSVQSSRRQSARAWELRTSVDLAAMLATQGRAESARDCLQPIFAEFTEGFDTADLQAAVRLLAAIS
jgi:predicted ATPase/DNA-binding winged helix-turn-helix (wHTH) protein